MTLADDAPLSANWKALLNDRMTAINSNAICPGINLFVPGDQSGVETAPFRERLLCQLWLHDLSEFDSIDTKDGPIKFDRLVVTWTHTQPGSLLAEGQIALVSGVGYCVAVAIFKKTAGLLSPSRQACMHIVVASKFHGSFVVPLSSILAPVNTRPSQSALFTEF